MHQVIITFDQAGAPTSEQLTFLSKLGVNGVSLSQLPIVGALANSAQIETIYARDDVLSVWNNEALEYENDGATKLTGVQELRGDQDLRKNGIPYSGRGIGVVVNDSGVDGTHSDLIFPEHVVQNVLAQTNLQSFSDLLPITYRENVANTDIGGGHGTHVAGTVGGNGAMSNGLHAGVAPGADIIGYGSGAALFILDTLGGFDYALTHQFEYNIRVISNSFGSTADTGTDFNPDHPTNVASKALADNGIITVFSAGNSGPGESTITGNFKKAPWVVTVAAGDKDGNLADFSSRGVDGKSGTATVDGIEYVWEDRPTVTAPGVDIISARASTSSLGGLSASKDEELIAPEHLAFYTTSSGTSMSAPHVSGIVALMLEANPNLNWQQVKQILQDTATVIPGREAWEVGAGYVNAYAAVKAAIEMDERFGDTTKLNREFNASANVTEGQSFTRTVDYTVAGESDFETFDVNDSTSLVLASANIESGTAFVLEDPAGNTYGSGIGLPVLGSSVGTSAPGMPGTWKVYVRGIGSVSGVSVDPTGLTNGIGLPGSVDVSIRLLETNGYDGIDDAAGHPGRAFIEYAISERLMDAEADGFNPDESVAKQTLADVLTLSGSVRQAQEGNKQIYLDSTSTNAAMLNAVSQKGATLKDAGYDFASVLPAESPDFFGSDELVTHERLAYSLVQSLGLESAAKSFDPAQDVQVVVFDQVVTLSDSDNIAPELKGYVQVALHMGLLNAQIKVEQDAFDLEPTLTATFAPERHFSRAELAKAVTRLHPLISQ
ncbi:S8 family serine peptidase [Pseudidiomarina planktonica]|uniref:S8 family serine peptidase n=1 Tax=Pseudidiomarina planktonica TaxID=1323738 RepID=UPI001F23F7EA|nr:S8 family serine peptidase [Pseudidiomarina planktonica]